MHSYSVFSIDYLIEEVEREVILLNESKASQEKDILVKQLVKGNNDWFSQSFSKTFNHEIDSDNFQIHKKKLLQNRYLQ